MSSTYAYPVFRVYTFGKFSVERLDSFATEQPGTPQYTCVSDDEWGGRQHGRYLLSLLLCGDCRRMPRDVLLETLWPDTEKSNADRYLNAAAWILRRILRDPTGTSLLRTVRPSSDLTIYELVDQQELWVDSDEFLDLLTRAEQVRQEGYDPLPLLEQAQALIRGEFLVEDMYHTWADQFRQNVNAARHRCLHWLTDLYEQRDMPGKAEVLFHEALKKDPGDEDIVYRLMHSLARQGRAREALSCYERLRRVLQNEYHTQPLACTQALAEEIQAASYSQETLLTRHSFLTMHEAHGTRKVSLSSSSVQQSTSVAPTSNTFFVPSATTFSDEMELVDWSSWFVSDVVSLDTMLFSTKQSPDNANPHVSFMQTRTQMLYQLLMFGSTALVLSPSTVLYPDESQQCNLSGLEELESITASYWKLSANTSLDLLGNLTEHFRTVVTLLQRTIPHETARRCCSLSGEIAQILGKTLFDLHEYSLAWSYYMFSLKAAQVASNHDLWAVGLGRMILLLIYWEAPQKALPLLQEVQQLTIQSTRIACWLAAVEAEVHAYLGNVDACDAALNSAKKRLESELLGEDQYATGFSPSRLAGYEGACFVRLRQPERALPALQQALSLLDSQAIRRRSTLFTDLGIAYAQQGNIKEACRLASQSLAIIMQTKSRAVLERVHKLCRELEPWKETEAVKELERHLDTAFKLISI